MLCYSQEWQLTQNEVLTENLFFETVDIGSYTLEVTKGLSTTYLFGSGTIIATNNPALAICSYECGITLPDVSELGNHSIPEQCDATLGLFNVSPQELQIKGIIHVYDITGRALFKDKYSCDCLKDLDHGFYIVKLYIAGNLIQTKKLVK